ncbi:hypothetical protein DFQ01_104107 [Paenibacillus cellulosilyticus]|uniref:Uncharacterized protein n=1 Tax=Paenibacillus cellulosilyticus TaxID=375489 RepID=A0A2V2YVU0_9BACL|nr:hypothetical protein [Paenibacillus cellulosilyticus]PWW05547.1 hypothetical protein DFQ01_104107 [Paenibacillus cellulosilyticus]QKS45417.1 hypothetical protein HUB94_14045 [Paenibacillus cellulosilyticus]
MDKRKAFAAYRRGWITISECAQIVGMSIEQLRSIMDGAMQTVETSERNERASLMH